MTKVLYMDEDNGEDKPSVYTQVGKSRKGDVWAVEKFKNEAGNIILLDPVEVLEAENAYLKMLAENRRNIITRFGSMVNVLYEHITHPNTVIDFEALQSNIDNLIAMMKKDLENDKE